MSKLRPTRNGHSIFLCASALQKALRRGEIEEAMFWAVELELSRYGEYLWKRMRVVASEDIGMANPDAAVQVRALYENWKEFRKGASKSERLMIVQAVLVLATSPKSRAVDHLNMVAFTEHDEKATTHVTPDYAYDMHTQQGRSKGRGMEHFFTESVKLDRTMADARHGTEHPALRSLMEGTDPWEQQAIHGKLAGKETYPKDAGQQEMVLDD